MKHIVQFVSGYLSSSISFRDVYLNFIVALNADESMFGIGFYSAMIDFRSALLLRMEESSITEGVSEESGGSLFKV